MLGMRSLKCSKYSTVRIVESNASSDNKLNDKYVYLVDVFDYLVIKLIHSRSQFHGHRRVVSCLCGWTAPFDSCHDFHVGSQLQQAHPSSNRARPVLAKESQTFSPLVDYDKLLTISSNVVFTQWGVFDYAEATFGGPRRYSIAH